LRRARSIRLDRGYTIEDVVRRTSIGAGHLSRFERGIAELSITKLQELARLYNVSIDALVAPGPHGSCEHEAIRCRNGRR
jgi:transcriptional regulator with XRE-family HTH domain